MGASYGTGAKGRATRLHSLIIRSIGECEKCGWQCGCPERPRKHTTGCRLQCSHIITRKYSRVRTDLENAFCLCASCHSYFTDNPIEHGLWALERMGAGTYDKLRQKAEAIDGQRMDWEVELDRLKTIARNMGIT